LVVGWEKYFRYTLDDAQIDAALSGFPVRILISSTSGSDNRDLTFVFDELGANSLKWAAEFNSAGSQCYGCVEYWDNGSEDAVIWVLPTSDIQDTAGQYIDIYFDNTHADNTAYIGTLDSNSVFTETNEKGAWLLSQSVAGTIRDATGNNNDGTVGGSGLFIVSGTNGKSTSFGGAGWIEIPDAASLNPGAADWTIETYAKFPDSNQYAFPVCKGVTGSIQYGFLITSGSWTPGQSMAGLNISAAGNRAKRSNTDVCDGNYHHFGIACNYGTDILLYQDGAALAATWLTTGTWGSPDTANPLYIGKRSDGYYFTGEIVAVFFAKTLRNSAWIKARAAGFNDIFGSYSDWLYNEVAATDSIVYDIIEPFTTTDSIVYDIIEPFTATDSIISGIELASNDSIIYGFEIQSGDSIIYSIYLLTTAADSIISSIELASDDSIIYGFEIQGSDSVIVNFEKQVGDSIVYSLSADVIAADSVVYDIFSELTVADSVVYNIQSIDMLVISDSIVYHLLNSPGLPASGSVSGGGIVVVNGVIPPGSVPADGQFVFDVTHGI
jgi:hypothetical protein